MSGATRRDNGKLGGLRRQQLIRALALEDVKQSALAARFDVTEGAITQFKHRYAKEISELRADAENELTQIAIANKANRLRALEEIHDVAMQPTPKVAGKDGDLVLDPETGEHVYEVDGRTALAALKQAAEEMGQLPTRLKVEGEVGVTTTYRIEGVSPDDLR